MTDPQPTPPRDRYVITGTTGWHEAYVYLRYVAALAKPGNRVPVFGAPRNANRSATGKDPTEQAMLLEEARSQIARQAESMQHNTTRAATLLTITVAELVFLTKVANNVLDHGPLAVGLWSAAVTFALLSLAGAVAVLTTRAEYGTVNLTAVIDSDEPTLAELAQRYADATDIGARTNATRLTVLRDAVLLAVVAGVGLVAVLLFNDPKDPEAGCKPPAGQTCTFSPIARTPSPTSQPSPVPSTLGSNTPVPSTPVPSAPPLPSTTTPTP